MKKRSLIIYLLFIMIVMLVPSRVMADHPTSGSITCTYKIDYKNVYQEENSKINLKVSIDSGAIKREWYSDSLNNTNGLEHKMENLGIGHYDFESLTIGEFVKTNGKKQDWTCPKIAYGIRDDIEGGYYMVVKTANNWKESDTEIFNSDNAIFNKSVTAEESNHKTPTSSNSNNDDIKEMCRFSVKYGSKVNDVQISINHSKKTAEYMINSDGYKTLDDFDFDRGCPEQIRYCVMDKSIGDFILTENKNCSEHLSGSDNAILLQNQIVSRDKGNHVIFDADGNANVIADEGGQTDLVDGKEADEAKKEVIDLIINPIDTDCEGILGDTIDIINEVLNWIKILAPILLIFFGSLDFGKAVLINDDAAIKKATSAFVKRAIAAVGVFFVPFIVNFILSLDGIKDVMGNALCEGIGKVVIK